MPQGASASDPNLLVTKLFVPLPRGAVERPRLSHRLDEAYEASRVALVVAPAGFGKTTLVADWLERRALSPAWLSLDAGDDDPVRFWRYVVAALRRLDPQLGEEALTHLQASAPGSLDVALVALVNAVHARLGDAVLVIEDVHHLENANLLNALDFFLGHLPPQLRVVLTGRTVPGLRLARLRASGRLVDITAQDLRMRPDEAEEVLRSFVPDPLEPEVVRALTDRADGWVTALRLATLRLHGSSPDGPASVLAGGDRHVADYLLDEVLADLPEELRRFLLETSVLERLRTDLCDAVTGRSDARAALDALDRSGLFLVALDDRRSWYRYHALFADLLRHRLRIEEGDARAAELERRAARWHRDAPDGDEGAAVQHALASGDPDLASEIVGRAARGAIARGELATVERWLGALPPSAQGVPLELARAWMALLRGDLASVVRAEASARAALTPDAPPAWRGETDAVAAYLAAARGAPERAAELAQGALAVIPADDFLRSAVALALGNARAVADDFAGAADAHREALRAAERTELRHMTLLAHQALGSVRRFQGRLRDADASFDAVLGRAGDAGASLPAAVFARLGKARVARERGRAEEARRHALTALEAAREHSTSRIDALLTLAFLEFDRGDAPAAEARLDESAAIVARLGAESLEERLATLRVRAALERGDLDPVRRWRGERTELLAAAGRSQRHLEHATLVRAMIAAGDLAAADALAERLLDDAARSGRRGHRLELLALRAAVALERGDEARAKEIVAEALDEARPEGQIGPLLEAGPAVRALLGRLGVGGVEPDPAATTASRSGEPRGSFAGPLEPLSEREIELLPMLVGGMSNKEIARRLDVSVNTVKTHVRHIYEKLAVGSRAKLVARVRELDLL